MIWTAGFRSAVISPYEQIQLTEPRGFSDQTVQQVLHMAGGGERFRVRLTNLYGRTPLTIAAATAATEHRPATLTFEGAEKVTIPPGQEAVSDPTDFPVAAGADLFLTLYLPEETGLATYSHMPMETAHITGGDHVPAQVEARFYVSGVDVFTPGDTTIASAFGDSWFEGVGSTVGANNRSVDVLNPVTAGALIEGFTTPASRAHTAGLKILAATIGPFAGAIYPGVSTPGGLTARREVNDWIRTTDTFDAVFDAVFDVARAVENPEAPDYIQPAMDAGDGMHLNDKGAQAMANAVDLETLGG